MQLRTQLANYQAVGRIVRYVGQASARHLVQLGIINHMEVVLKCMQLVGVGCLRVGWNSFGGTLGVGWDPRSRVEL